MLPVRRWRQSRRDAGGTFGFAQTGEVGLQAYLLPVVVESGEGALVGRCMHGRLRRWRQEEKLVVLEAR